MKACSLGKTEIVDLILEKSHGAVVMCEAGGAALWEAVKSGNASGASWHLSGTLDPRYKNILKPR
jgi:hypothetical protein